jgi:serine/threonine-protein kinase
MPQPVPQPVPKTGELGGLTVVCLPACTQVVDNGSSLGPSPIFARPVPSGPHTLTLTSGSVKKTYKTTVAAGKTTEVRQPMSD